MRVLDAFSRPPMLPSDWQNKHATAQEPWAGPALYNNLPCPTCKARTNEWCQQVHMGTSCRARFDMWVKMGRPLIIQKLEELEELMILATYGDSP